MVMVMLVMMVMIMTVIMMKIMIIHCKTREEEQCHETYVTFFNAATEEQVTINQPPHLLNALLSKSIVVCIFQNTQNTQYLAQFPV